MTYLHPILQSLLMLVALPAAAFDLRERRIPNWLALAGLVAGFAANLFWGSIAGSLAGAGLALLIYLPLWILKAVGAGDAKLMAAVGAIVGPGRWIAIFVFAFVFSAVVGLALVTAKGRLGPTLRNAGLILRSLIKLQAPYRDHPALDIGSKDSLRMPHAVSVLAGSIALLVRFYMQPD